MKLPGWDSSSIALIPGLYLLLVPKAGQGRINTPRRR